MSTAVMDALALLVQFDLYDAVAITFATVLAIMWSLQARSQSVDQPTLLKQKPQAPAMQAYRVTCNISRELEESDLLSWERPQEEVARNSRMSSQIDMRQSMGHPRYSQESVRFSSRSIAEITAPRRSGRVSFAGEQMRGFRSSMAPVRELAQAQSNPMPSRPSEPYRISIQELMLDCGTSEVAFPATLTHSRRRTNAHPAYPRKITTIAPPAPRDSAPSVSYMDLKHNFMQQPGTVA